MRKIIKNPHKIKNADIVVGIPTLNEADNVDFVAETVDKGLQKYFKKYKSVIIDLDNDSPDDTKKVFLNAKTKTPKMYVSTPKGVRGKGNNFLNLFDMVKEFKPRAVLVVDADLKSITPEWVRDFLNPVLSEEYDYVVPYYVRNEYDGTITNNIAYPLIYGVYGINIRQPIGGDFAFSPKLIEEWTKKRWHKAIKQYGVDIYMTLGAVIAGYRICQIRLGEKIHKPSAPKLGPMFSQVVATIFKKITKSREQWEKIDKIQAVPLLGEEKQGKPQPLGVDYKNMKITALFEYKMYRDILRRGLSPEVFKKVDKIFKEEKIIIPKTLWTKIVYDALHAYHTTDLNMGLIEALRPLYFGKVISFIKHTMDLSYKESEDEILEQAQRFWDMRGYLLDKK